MTAFPDIQVFMDDLVMQDDGVIYHWTLTEPTPGRVGQAARCASAASKSGRLAQTVSSLIRMATLIALITAINSR
jgi:hypothetical protein